MDFFFKFLSYIFQLIDSWGSEHLSAKYENEKMKQVWEHEDDHSDESAFSEMSSAISQYILSDTRENQSCAIEKVAAIRFKENGSFGHELDKLHDDILSGDTERVHNQLLRVGYKRRKANRKRKRKKSKQLIFSK